jgi:type IV pilus assembly protein PilO
MTKVRQWTLLAVAAVGAVLVTGWFLLIAPVRNETVALEEQSAQQQLAVQSLTSQLAILRGQAADLPAQQARLTELKTAMPEGDELAPLVRMLTTAAEETGVRLRTIAPSPATAGAGQYSQIAMSLSLSGNYFALQQFLGSLEDLPRTFLVTSFALSPEGDLETQALQLSLNGTVLTTVQPVDPAAQAAATPAAATDPAAAEPAPADPAAADAPAS